MRIAFYYRKGGTTFGCMLPEEKERFHAFFCRRTEAGGGKIPIKKAGSWGQEKINIFLSWT